MHAVWAKHGGDDARKAAISRLTSGRTDSSSELTADEVSALMDLTAELDNALSEALQAAKDNLKAPLEDINTSKTILEMTLEVLQSEVAEYPLLQYFIDYLEPFKVDHILGEINAYRDAHARVMTTTWHVLLANDPSMSSLALRARLDIDIWGNYSDETYIAHWEDLVLPWLRHRSQYFSPHLAAAKALPEAVPEADAPVAD